MPRLIDADAIIEVMKKCAENPENAQALLCYRYTQRILEEAPTVEPASPWHRVEDGLPNDTRDVLAVRRYGNDLEKQEVIVAHLSVIMDMRRGFDKWWNATNITHWMPFPEPPKED